MIFLAVFPGFSCFPINRNLHLFSFSFVTYLCDLLPLLFLVIFTPWAALGFFSSGRDTGVIHWRYRVYCPWGRRWLFTRLYSSISFVYCLCNVICNVILTYPAQKMALPANIASPKEVLCILVAKEGDLTV